MSVEREEDLQLHSKENKFFLLKDRKDEYERQKEIFILVIKKLMVNEA